MFSPSDRLLRLANSIRRDPVLPILLAPQDRKIEPGDVDDLHLTATLHCASCIRIRERVAKSLATRIRMALNNDHAPLRHAPTASPGFRGGVRPDIGNLTRTSAGSRPGSTSPSKNRANAS